MLRSIDAFAYSPQFNIHVMSVIEVHVSENHSVSILLTWINYNVRMDM